MWQMSTWPASAAACSGERLLWCSILKLGSIPSTVNKHNFTNYIRCNHNALPDTYDGRHGWHGYLQDKKWALDPWWSHYTTMPYRQKSGPTCADKTYASPTWNLIGMFIRVFYRAHSSPWVLVFADIPISPSCKLMKTVIRANKAPRTVMSQE